MPDSGDHVQLHACRLRPEQIRCRTGRLHSRSGQGALLKAENEQHVDCALMTPDMSRSAQYS